MPTNKERAVDFLKLVVSGRIEEAYGKYVDMAGKHHNAFFPAGFDSLRTAMIGNRTQFPDKKYEVRNAIAEDDLVAVHAHLTLSPREKGMVVVHIARFSGDRIVEIWDCGQQLPADSRNLDGPF